MKNTHERYYTHNDKFTSTINLLMNISNSIKSLINHNDIKVYNYELCKK